MLRQGGGRVGRQLSLGEVLLLACWLCYTAFIATNTAFYGIGFPAAIGFFLPIVVVCGIFLVRRPLLTLLVLCISAFLPFGGLDWWTQKAPFLPTEPVAITTAVLGAFLGVPLIWAPRRAWTKRKRVSQDAQRTRLARFQARARLVAAAPDGKASLQ